MKTTTYLCILISSLYIQSAQAQQYALIWVESNLWGSKIDSLQFTVNDQHSHVCNSSSAYCPNRQLMTVPSKKGILFNLDEYTGGGYGYTISESCRKKSIMLKKHDVMNVQFVLNGQVIACEYSMEGSS